MEATRAAVLLAALGVAGCAPFEPGSFLGYEPAPLNIDTTDARGVCVADVDADGDLDVLFTRAAGPALWIQRGEAGWVEESAERGLPGAGQWLGCGFADIDRDGDEDLVLTDHEGPTRLLRNDGGAFVDRTVAAGLGDARENGSVVWADLDLDGTLDLLLTGLEPGMTRLYEGRPDGTFVDRTEDAGLEDVPRSWSAASFDADNDGTPDPYIATDVAQPAESATDDRFLLGRGDFTFLDITVESQVTNATDGMGIAVGDVDQDTLLDFFVTNIGTHFLWRNLGGLVLNTSTAARIDNGGGRVGWGTFFLDADEDANLDLFVANGGYYERGEVEPLHEGPLPRNRLFMQSEWSADFPQFRDGGRHLLPQGGESSMGAAWGDLDGDGRLDLLVANQDGARVDVLRSRGHEGPDPGALRLKLRGTRCNREALGARVVAETCRRSTLHTVGTGPSVFSQGERTLHVPLEGCTGDVEVFVEWPGGAEEHFVVEDPRREVVVVLTEGDGEE